MSFWLGVFAGLAGWRVLTFPQSLARYGRGDTDGLTLLVDVAELFLFAVVAWYLALFGGAA